MELASSQKANIGGKFRHLPPFNSARILSSLSPINPQIITSDGDDAMANHLPINGGFSLGFLRRPFGWPTCGIIPVYKVPAVIHPHHRNSNRSLQPPPPPPPAASITFPRSHNVAVPEGQNLLAEPHITCRTGSLKPPHEE